MALEVFLLLGGTRVAARMTRRMGGAVLFKFRIGHFGVVQLGVIAVGSKFPVKLERADVWRILKTDAVRNKSIIRNRNRKFACLLGDYANAKRILADLRPADKADILDDCLAVHFAPGAAAAAISAVGLAATSAAFLRRLTRLRFGGVPSAGSMTIRLVTNFFIPWTSKSIEVRSESVSVITPSPY